MNRADHRRLSWVLSGTTACALGAVTLQGLGIGNAISWGDTIVAPAPLLPATKITPLPAPIGQAYEQVWRRNLFSPTRQADQAHAQAEEDPMSGYTLTGVILSGSLHIALLTDPSGKGHSIISGHTLPHTDWTLTSVERREAHFSADGRDVSLAMHKSSYPEGPPAIPGGPADRGSRSQGSGEPAGSGNTPTSSQDAGADARANAADGHSVPQLPPLPPGM